MLDGGIASRTSLPAAIASRPRAPATVGRAPAPRCAWLLAVLALAPACFSDGGYHPAGATALTTDDATTDTTTTTTTTSTTGLETPATTTTTTGEPAPVCGDGVVDPDTEACDDGNRDDGDACLGTCVAASCGDGVVWLGVEDCDQGADNHPTAPDTCRPTCKLPACGDGGLYVGPLGPDVALPVGEEAIDGGDDAPRMIGAAADGSFVVTWHVTGLLGKVQTRRVDPDGLPLGGVVEVVEQPFLQIRDPVIAVAPNGDYAVAWQTEGDSDQLTVRGVAADLPAAAFALTDRSAASAALGLDPGGALIAAYRAGGLKQTPQIYLRRFPLFTDSASPPEQAISDHPLGAVGSPTIALHADGGFLVAWSDPDGAIVYRRFTPDLVAGRLVTTGLVVGGGTGGNARPWTGAALQPDGAAVIAGRDADGHLVLQRFDAADFARGSVQVDDVDARHVPFVDVAADAWGHLAVAWSTCGAPGDVAPTCADLPSVSSFRRFYADLTPHGPAAEVTTRNGMPRPLSLAVAPTGAAAVARVEGDKVLLNMSPVQCPP
ncbi:Myxococcus cysteine-rich repeat-containing protein [Nannocystis exedens]|uniref:Myxococcus cysteine-rich repeat-containing protein n=1 Tax=Nannocystis exedens TaxID=54 RepID=A0A1I1VCA7_9BACT|nr:hypothetical protein [Nannocystis exedens]PCC72464.1 regulator of chromosome condensation RCC1 [Nannocystis exedens]SFD79618.1 Myxococcus cysteine-rich repeat-containing protein [Nannocystis exedens]